MNEAFFGMLLKRKNINFKYKKLEIWELVDFVFGIQFVNEQKEEIFAICSDKYLNEPPYHILSADVVDNNKIEYIIVPQEICKIIEMNDNIVDFKAIHDTFMKKSEKYYTYAKFTNGMKPIKDKKLLIYLDSIDKNDDKILLYPNDSAKKKVEVASNPAVNILTMYDNIRQTIIAQDEQIKEILTAIYKNQVVINSEINLENMLKLKENILICGPTGTGKTEILKRIAALYNVPIVIEDATLFSETGYVGRDIEDMLYDLYVAAGYDVNKAQRGILVIDEFDKLAENSGNSRANISRIGVQRSLLKLLDGSTYWFSKKSNSFLNNNTEKQKFDTTRLTIVCIGAFSGIVDDLNRQNIGFNTNLDDSINEKSSYKNLKTEHFVKYGIMQELMGRFSKTVAMNSLTKEDLKNILLKSNFSPINVYMVLFVGMNIDFEYSDEFIDWVSEQAVISKSGARSLKTIVDVCISDALFRIFSDNYSKIELVKPYNDNDTSKSYILTKNF